MKSSDALTKRKNHLESFLHECVNRKDIMASDSWQKYFPQNFDPYWGMLKKAPAGFDPNFKHIDWLKHKTFTFSTPLSDKEVCSPDFIDHIMEIATAAKPMNDFLNYTFEEYGEFPSRC